MGTITLPLDFLAKKLNISASEFAETFKIGEGEDAINATLLKELESKFDSVFESKFNEGHKDGHGEALRKGLSEREKNFSDKYGVKKGTFDEMGDELINKIKEANKNLDPNDVRATEVYLNDIKKRDDEIAQLQNTITENQNQFQWQATTQKSRRAFEKMLKDEGFDMSNTKLIDLVFNQSISGKHKPTLTDDEDIVMIDDSGTKVRVSGKDVLSYYDHSKSIASTYLNVGGQPPATPGGQTTGGIGQQYTFKTYEEAEAALDKATSKEEQDQIIEAAKKFLD